VTRVIAIDGPAGSGKSSVSRAVAKSLGYGFLDTGAAYRALTWWALESGVDVHDGEAVEALIRDFPYSISMDPSVERVTVGETDVTREIREPRISLSVSAIASQLPIRAWMVNTTRELAQSTDRPGVVVEGRDNTTVVFPDADVRILLTAREDVRIARRSGEISADAGVTAQSIRERDDKDSTVVEFRTAAEGVDVVDSSDIGFDETVEAICDLCERRGS
jgi:cytidylate kinase